MLSVLCPLATGRSDELVFFGTLAIPHTWPQFSQHTYNADSLRQTTRASGLSHLNTLVCESRVGRVLMVTECRAAPSA